MSTWYTQPVFGSHLAVALIVLALVALLAVGPAFRRLSWPRRGALLTLRLAVILLLLLALLRPGRVSTVSKPQTGVVIALVDMSKSMTLPSGNTSRNRWETQTDALAACDDELAALAEHFDLKVYGYDRRLTALETKNGQISWPGAPAGKETDVGTILAEATRKELGRRILGVVLVGDGVQTALEPKVEAQAAARELAQQGSPLFTTVIGPIGDAAKSRDVALEYMQDQYTVFVKNEVVLKGLVRITGFVNREIPLALTIEDASGKKESLGPKNLIARSDGQQLEVSFPYTPKSPGQYKLTLRAEPQTGELVTKNNELQSFLNVLEGGLKVLYLEGDLRLEQKFLRRSLNDSPDIDVDFQWIDHRARDRWPVDFGETFTKPKFDVLILGDLDAAALGAKTIGEIEALIDKRGTSAHGKGLLTLGGFHSYGAGGYQSTRLADVLPVTMDRLLRQDFGRPVLEAQLHHRGPLKMLPTAEHKLVQLAGAADNAAAWSKLPPLRGANRVLDVKERFRPIAMAGQVPLLVPAEYGDGRVVSFLGDSTWQWWMQGHEAEHRRFWRQIILWLAWREDDVQSDVWVTLRQRRFNPGAKVAFQLGAKSPAGDEIAGAVLSAIVTLPDGTTQPARLTREAVGWTGLFAQTAQPGDYKLEVSATLEGKPIGSTRTQFLVFDQDLELASQAADPELMARLANLTKASGGRVVPPEELPALFAELAAKPRETLVEVQTRWQLGDTTFDAWLYFLVFVALLSGEWFLRKKWQLV